MIGFSCRANAKVGQCYSDTQMRLDLIKHRLTAVSSSTTILNYLFLYVVRSRSFDTFLGEIFLFYIRTCHCTVSFLCLFQVGRPNFKFLG